MDGSDPWDWKEDSFVLDVDSPLVLSQSLWDEWTQSEAENRTLFTSTPLSEVTDPRLPDIKSNEGKNEDTINPDHTSKGSPRCKRRRMLLFPGDQSESVFCDSNPCQQCEGGIGLNNSESHLLGEYQDMQVPDSASTSHWFSANEDPFCPGNETAEKWMLGCINEREGHILGDHELNALLPLTQIPVAMRSQSEPPGVSVEGDARSIPSSPSGSTATGLSGGISLGLQYKGAWCTPLRIFVEHQDEVIPHPSTVDPDDIEVVNRMENRMQKRPVRISAWRLAKLNPDEAMRAAAKARESSSVLCPVGARGVPDTDYSSIVGLLNG